MRKPLKPTLAEFLNLRFLAIIYLGMSLITMLIANVFTLNFTGIYNERGIYQHQLDNAFLSCAAFLMVVSMGLTLILWVNILHYAKTMNSAIPLWRKFVTVIFVVSLTLLAVLLLLCSSVVQRDHPLTAISSYIAYVVGGVVIVGVFVGYTIYGLRLVHMLTRNGKKLDAFNLKFTRFMIAFGATVIFLFLFLVFYIISATDNQSKWSYGFYFVQKPTDMFIYLLAAEVTFLYFKKQDLIGERKKKIEHEGHVQKEEPIDIEPEKPEMMPEQV